MIEDRLSELRSELEKGHQQMTLMDQRRQELRDTLLRISGAIQVLEELRERTVASDAAATSRDAAGSNAAAASGRVRPVLSTVAAA
jgi:hypothetical protein